MVDISNCGWFDTVAADGGGRVTIPKSMREALGIGKDERLLFQANPNEGVIILSKIKQETCPACGKPLTH